MSDKSSDAERIMVVDDTPENLTLLNDMLRHGGYQVFALPNGEMALKAAAKNPPDLILLDINMPGLNGYEVCKRLKADEHLAEIPVIFLSAYNETEHKITAFQAGGVDYITKPFQSEEVEARVRIHLKLRQLQRELHEQNLNLESLVAQRTRELEEAYARLRRLDQVKSDFLTMISHEMRTPLNGIFGLAQIAMDLAPESAERSELWEMYQSTRRRVDRLLDDAETLNSLESTHDHTQLGRISIGEAFHEAELITAPIRVLADFPSGFASVWVLGEDSLLRRALETLIQLAACFTLARDTVKVSGTLEQDRVRLDFALDNLQLSEEKAAGFFEIDSLARSSSLAEPLALAPVVAHRIITLFRGDVRFIRQDAATGRLCIELVQWV